MKKLFKFRIQQRHLSTVSFKFFIVRNSYACMISYNEQLCVQFKLKELREKEDKQEAIHLLDMRMEADRLFAEKQTERQKNIRDNYKELQGKAN